MQLTPEQLSKPLENLSARDALIGLQLVTRLLSLGAVKETEILAVGQFRTNLVDSLKAATEIDYNEVIEAQIVAAQNAAKAASEAEQSKSTKNKKR